MRGLRPKGKGRAAVARQAQNHEAAVIESALPFRAQSTGGHGPRRGWRRQLMKTTLPGPAHPHGAHDPVAHLIALREAIARRARDCGRAPESVKLVAVSKTFSADQVWPTIALVGQTRFGENRVQEAIPKWRDLRARAATLGKTIELHLIGPLQSNKAREAIEPFALSEPVAGEKAAAPLAREIERAGNPPRLFVEVNTGGEPQKAGV